jgi:hypothetical protein
MANTLAYYDTATITAVKSFIVQAPGVSFAKILPNFSLCLFILQFYYLRTRVGGIHKNVLRTSYDHFLQNAALFQERSLYFKLAFLAKLRLFHA